MTSLTRRSLVALLGALCLVGAACSGGSDDDTASSDTTVADAPDDLASIDDGGTEAGPLEPGLTVVVANSAGAITTSGTQRVMTALVAGGVNGFVGGPNQPVSIRFDSVDGDTVAEVDGTWLTTDASPLGLYVSYHDFDVAGLWEVTAFGDGEELGTTLIEVVNESPIPNIGDQAPRSDSLTGTTPEELAAISTDQAPDPTFYDLSIADAVANGQPSVIAFITPAFCQTALCGPTLETVKAATAGRDGLDVVHVEPFDIELATQGTLLPIPVMDEWGLVTEPWVFVVDGDGTITASFEGILGRAELDAALDAVAG